MPVRSQRSKGIKTKHAVQICLLIAVCFWLIFQLKRSHHKNQDFDANEPKISHSHQILKFGRKDIQPKIEQTLQEEDEDNKHGQDEDKIEEEKDDENELQKSNIDIDRKDVDIIDEYKETEEKETEEMDGHMVDRDEDQETEEIDVQSQNQDRVDRYEDKETEETETEEIDGQRQTENTVDHDEDRETEETETEEIDGQNQTENSAVGHDEDRETEEKESEEIDGQSQTENRVDHDEDQETEEKESEEIDVQNQTENSAVDHDEGGSTEHTHEAREEHYKADDASSAVITHDAENEFKNGTLDNSIESHENGPPTNTTLMSSTSVNETVTEITQGPSYSTDLPETLESNESTAEEDRTNPLKNENLETKYEDFSNPAHLEEKDLERLAEIEEEGGNNEQTAAE